MFLTTNLVKKIDHAIWSRIDWVKKYESLSAKNQALLWKGFLRNIDPQVGQACLDKHIANLAKEGLNGREVSNEQLIDHH
jgi:hypothetical protein